MSTVDTTRQALPTATWQSDAVHSSIDFSVKHIVVSSFRGSVPSFEATVSSADDTLRVEGVAQVAAIKTQDSNLDAHLQAPDFFDGERHPELRFSAAAL